jgi:hypothetical protein
LSGAVASVWEWTLWVAMVVAQIALVGLACILAFEGRSARPWMFLALLATVAVAIAEIAVGISRWNTFVEVWPAAYITVGLMVIATPIVLLWGFVSACRRKVALWQTLGGSILSLLILGTTFFTYVGDG